MQIACCASLRPPAAAVKLAAARRPRQQRLAAPCRASGAPDEEEQALRIAAGVELPSQGQVRQRPWWWLHSVDQAAQRAGRGRPPSAARPLPAAAAAACRHPQGCSPAVAPLRPSLRALAHSSSHPSPTAARHSAPLRRRQPACRRLTHTAAALVCCAVRRRRWRAWRTLSTSTASSWRSWRPRPTTWRCARGEGGAFVVAAAAATAALLLPPSPLLCWCSQPGEGEGAA